MAFSEGVTLCQLWLEKLFLTKSRYLLFVTDFVNGLDRFEELEIHDFYLEHPLIIKDGVISASYSKTDKSIQFMFMVDYETVRVININTQENIFYQDKLLDLDDNVLVYYKPVTPLCIEPITKSLLRKKP